MAPRVSLKDRIRQQLIDKLDVSARGLNGKVGAIAKHLAISAEDATYVLAHENRINITKLDQETLTRVRGHLARRHADVSPASPAATARRSASRARSTASATTPRVLNIKVGTIDVTGVPCMSASMGQKAKRVAEQGYIPIFLIENSARDLITRVMKAAHGANWWSTKVSQAVTKKAADYAANEGKQAWHPARGSDPIQFVDLLDLVQIVEMNWSDFRQIFPRNNWFRTIIEDLNVSRRVVAHMNDLDPNTYKLIDAAFIKWTNQLKAKSAFIPA